MPVRFASVAGGSFKLSDGNDVPKIGLGISGIEEQAKLTSAVRAALSAGYRLFDTAHIYNNEQLLGNALKVVLPELGLKREDVFITTKESLRKLQTSYVDLLLVHYPRDRDHGSDDDERNKESRKAIWQWMETVHAAGERVKSIGVSNYEVYHLAEQRQYSKVSPALNQFEYHPYNTEKLLRRYCKDNGIVFQAFSSLLWGNQDILNEQPIKAAAEKHRVTPQIILYAFAYQTDVALIPKSETPSRISGNLLDTLKTTLTEEETRAILALNKNQMFAPRIDPENCI